MHINAFGHLFCYYRYFWLVTLSLMYALSNKRYAEVTHQV